MEKLIEVIFSNFFLVIVVITGIAKLFKKVSGTDFKPDSEGRNQKTFKETSKKFNIFDFDLEKWLEEQSGKQKNNPIGIPGRLKSADQLKKDPNNLSNYETINQQTNPFVGNKASTATNTSSISIEDNTKKQFDIDITDMQRAVIMAEVLGPPRSKRKSYRY